MRKFTPLLLLSCAVLLFFAVPGRDDGEPSSVSSVMPASVYLDGNLMTFRTPPKVEDGTLLIPLQEILQQQQADINWEAATGSIEAVWEEARLVYTAGSDTALLNEQTRKLSAVGRIVDGSLLVPLLFLSEALEYTAAQEPDSGIVIISSAAKQPAVVKRIIDGDTLEVEIEATPFRVRLIGIDTPESVHPDADRNSEAGILASDYAKAQLAGAAVMLEYDAGRTDRYGRLLAYVYTESGIMFNAQLAAAGYAKQMTVPPNVRWVGLFQALIADARVHDRGLWAFEEPIPLIEIVSVDYVGEIVMIQNNDSSDVNMTGWTLVSVKGNQVYHFPDNFLLQAGESIAVVSGRDAADGEGKLKWTTANVHNNDEDDPAELYDHNGSLVSEYR